ncbi:MAG: mechanosensitive ion channel family protein [bacterium]|nr:mechanosensitive ion channel family protein [bacterium]
MNLSVLDNLLPPEMAGLVSAERLLSIFSAFLILVIGWVLARLARKLIRSLPETALVQPYRLLVQRSLFWGLFSLFLMAAMHQLGLNLGVLLGAAGVFSLAIGFAAQTSVSNLISGLFLMGERSFIIGDLIKQGDHMGEVVAIDLFSVKLKTFDNLLVRIPNETLIKSSFTNYSALPIRRYDMDLGIAYKEDTQKTVELLHQVAENNVFCLAQPKPIVIFIGFGSSSVDLRYCVWGASSDYLDLRNSFALEVKAALDAAGIEIPYPHLSLYAGEATQPMPVKLSRED